jgi:cob(I)alamin adenosyltransferase
LVVVNTGDGKGKSTAAFGIMLRGVARGWRVAVLQFIKSGDWAVGEEKVGRQLGVDWWALGEGFTWDTADPDHDRDVAAAAWEKAKAVIDAGEHQLVILDEVTYLLNWGWIDTDEFVQTITRPTVEDQHRRHRAGRALATGRHRRHGHRDARDQARVPPGHPRQARHRLLRIDH